MSHRRCGTAFLQLALLASACATSPAPEGGDGALLSPSDLVATLAEVATGRNADLAETGLALKTIELKLVVGRERRSAARASFLVLDAASSRRSDVSFTQTFTFDLPPPERRRSAVPIVAVPGVAEFIDAAIATARELAAAAAREGLPQKLSEVELTAKIVRSTRAEGGVGFSGLGSASIGGGVSRVSDDSNTVRLVFRTRP